MCEIQCFKHPSVSCCPTRSFLLVWMLASPNMDSWHTGKHRQGNTAANIETERKMVTSSSCWRVGKKENWKYTHASTGRFWLVRLCFPLTLLLQLVSEATRATQNASLIISLCTVSLAPVTVQHASVCFKVICAVTSPVLAGFLLLGCSFSTGGCFKWGRVWLLQVLFIQKSIRIHQILQQEGEPMGWRDGEMCTVVCMSYRNTPVWLWAGMVTMCEVSLCG